MEIEQKKSNDKICSIVLLCGYLGSGKTTLLSNILKKQAYYKIAVIQNEFSDEMGIESPLIQDSNSNIFDKFYELPNGCICCSAKSDLLAAIEYLILNEKYLLDYIIIETNGLADPSKIIKQFWVDASLNFPSELRSIHCIVPTHRIKQLIDNHIFKMQILYADYIILNYMDQADAEDVKFAKEKITLINPLAIFCETKYCQLDVQLLFDSDQYSLRQERLQLMSDDLSQHQHTHCNTNLITNSINDAIQSVYLECNQSFNAHLLETLIGKLVWECQDAKILRMKGLIVIQDDEYAYSLQGVEDVFELTKSQIKWESIEHQLQIERKSKFLFIGHNIDSEKLKLALDIQQ